MKGQSISRWLAATFAVLVLAGISTAAASATKCIQRTDAQRRAAASVIFDGVALDGQTSTGVQRFRVTRYIKGRGPRVVRVQTGRGISVVSSAGIKVERGERWRIFATGKPKKVLNTSTCAGSRKL